MWDLFDLPITTLPAIAPLLGSGDDMMARIEKVARAVVSPDRLLISLGGEHAVTAPLVRAHASIFSDLTVVHLDAHADLRDSYEGSGASHASAMRRVAEQVPVLSVGVRSLSADEAAWLTSQKRVEVLFTHQMRRDPDLLNSTLARVRGPVYVTIDVDVFDPSIMPGVGTPEPGGLSWESVIHILDVIAANATIVGADIVELAPIPGNVVSEFAAARLVAKMIAYTFDPSNRSNNHGEKH
jgi:agmatinase